MTLLPALIPLLLPPSQAGSPQPHEALPPSIHAAHSARPPVVRAPAAAPRTPPMPVGEPRIWVYGYLPYWVGGLAAVPWEHITHLAIFDVGLNSDGSLSSTSRWTSIAAEAVSTGAAHNVKVHLTLTCFSDSTMAAVLPSATLRAKVISQVAALVDAAGAHGVSVDFEGMGIAQKADLVRFVQELRAQVGEVTVATPAVDWSGAYDYDQLAAASDALFIMGYGYHWSGGDPGPGAPLYGGSPWSKYSLEWTVSDYQANGAGAGSLVLGLPLYGHEWPTTSNSVPGTATGDADAITMADAIAEGARYGRLYESLTETPYAFPSSTSQLWYEDNTSIEAKVAWAAEQGLLGVGFWALGYDALEPEFWAMIDRHSGAAEEPEPEDSQPPDSAAPDDTGAPDAGLRARAGQDIMAWVGQTVVFSGRGSGAEDLGFAWTQVGGPAVTLRGADSASARFTAEQTGTYVFSLTVSDGAQTSAPDSVSVVVLDAPAGTCTSGPPGGAGGLALGLLSALALRCAGSARGTTRRPRTACATARGPARG